MTSVTKIKKLGGLRVWKLQKRTFLGFPFTPCIPTVAKEPPPIKDLEETNETHEDGGKIVIKYFMR